METATIKSWPEWLHWCSVSINSQGQWPEKPSRVATYWLHRSPLKHNGFMLASRNSWFLYKGFISEREKSKLDGTIN
jgi:hypothetical protein